MTMQKVKPKHDQVPSTVSKGKEWTRNASNVQGYLENYYIETLHGDQISLDFNRFQKMIRISIRKESQPGKEYISILRGGRILQERENSLETTRRPKNLTTIMQTLYPYFIKLEKREIVKIIGSNYSFPKLTGYRVDGNFPIARKFFFKKSLRDRFKEHLLNKRNLEDNIKSPSHRFLNRLWQECLDIGLGVAAIIFILSNGYLSPMGVAFLSGALGILTGALDMFWRQRSPFSFKIIFFMGISVFTIYIQLQNRVWGIFMQ